MRRDLRGIILRRPTAEAQPHQRKHVVYGGAAGRQGELMYGPEVVGNVAQTIAGWGFTWTPEDVRVWREGDVAWAQVLGVVVTRRDGIEAIVPYWTTGVFAREESGWRWRYWGGAEPQAEPRV
jgi:SnoaL-like domain